jgi:hypothetical protein
MTMTVTAVKPFGIFGPRRNQQFPERVRYFRTCRQVARSNPESARAQLQIEQFTNTRLQRVILRVTVREHAFPVSAAPRA